MSRRTITAKLTYEDLRAIHGWSSFVKHTRDEDGETIWDEEDERVRALVYDLMHPFLAPCLAGILDAHDEREAEREALRREARQEAMLDAGPMLAEYRRAKGEL